MVHEYFEVDKNMVKDLGFEWMDTSEFRVYYDPAKVYKGSMMSRDVKFEDIKDKIFLCVKSNLPYNIQKRELEILQKKELPLPDRHWRTRLEERAKNFIFPWELHLRETSDTHHMVESPVPDKYKIQEQAIE